MSKGRHSSVWKGIAEAFGVEPSQVHGVLFTGNIPVQYYRQSRLRPPLPEGLESMEVEYHSLSDLWLVPSKKETILVSHNDGYILVTSEAII